MTAPMTPPSPDASPAPSDPEAPGAAETPGPAAGAAPVDKIRGALTRYRVLAWVTGVWLLLLVAEMVAKYLLDVTMPGWTDLIPIAHGWIYFAYLLVTLDLAVKVRWPWRETIVTLLAGTIPFLSFWFEHQRTREVRAAYGL